MADPASLALAAFADIATVLSRPVRGIAPLDESGNELEMITPDVVTSETHGDELSITEHPVEQGAAISDHAFRQPATVTLSFGWRDGTLRAGALHGPSFNPLTKFGSNFQLNTIYDKLLALQRNRTLCRVYTGKRVYETALVRSLHTETTKDSEHVLAVRVTLREVILVSTTLTSVTPDSVQANAEVTGNITNVGTVNPTSTSDGAAARAAAVRGPL